MICDLIIIIIIKVFFKFVAYLFIYLFIFAREFDNSQKCKMRVATFPKERTLTKACGNEIRGYFWKVAS